MTFSKFFICRKAFVSLVLVGVLMPYSALAQSEEASAEVSLESYLEDDEPDQAALSAPQETLPVQNEGDVVAQPDVGVTVNQGTADALPAVETTRLNIRAKGFDDVGSTSIYTEFEAGGQDPSRQTQAELAEEIRREAYDAAITGLFPLSPDNIKGLLKEYDKTKRAVEEPVHGTPTPRVNVETVSLDPGVAPMVLKTAIGHITTLNVLDVTGAPWPIQDISWAGDFEVIEPEEGGHVVRITPMGHSAYGNISMRLLTLKTPVTITLKTGTDEVQYRVDARIPEFGPFAQTPIIEGGSDRVAGGSLIMSVLDGTPPTDAVRLDVSGVDGRTTAYKVRSTTYVRTPLTLLSPGWDQSVSSADGMNVYALNNTPVVLLSDRGRFMRASLTARKDLFDE